MGEEDKLVILSYLIIGGDDAVNSVFADSCS